MAFTDADVAAGQVLIAGTYGTDLSAAMARRIERGLVGGLILMGRNVERPAQVRRLLVDAAAAASSNRPPPLLAVDQEGGRVARLKAPVLQLPAARDLGAIDDAALTRRAFAALGRQLRALGFTVDFAPVLDVEGGSAREVIGDRSFAGEAAQAGRHGAAAVAGLLDSGVCPCGKHFPGHGVTIVDSHRSLPSSPRALAELRARELGPFAAAIAAGLPMVMPAHVVYLGVDPAHPATTSPVLLRAVLRGELRFEGAVVTDDLKMGAVSDAGGPVEVALEALMAGADLMLMCHDEDIQERIRAALADAARRSPAVASRLDEAAARSLELRRRFAPSPAPEDALDEAFGSDEALAVARAMERGT
jgi:beta-N-acetylhexosaminidase